MAILKFTLDGVEHIVDTSIDHVILDPESERYNVASLIAHWGIIGSIAKDALARKKSELKSWYAKSVAVLLGKDGKLPEWKAEFLVEAQDGYLMLCHDITTAEALCNKLDSVYEGFIKKHEMLIKIVSRENGEYTKSSGDIGRERKDSRFDEFKANRRQRTE